MKPALALCALLLASLPTALAHAQSTIKRPGDRPHYVFELEPELVFAPFSPPNAAGNTARVRDGLRGTVEVAPDGFIPKLNDSVGIGFGFDYLHYNGDGREGCARFVPGPANTRVCVETTGNGAGYFYVPVVMQWNFWLHRRWSVFGEPGVAFYYHDKLEFSPFVLEAGGRFHISDAVALTLRVGFPTLSLGVSFLL